MSLRASSEARLLLATDGRSMPARRKEKRNLRIHVRPQEDMVLTPKPEGNHRALFPQPLRHARRLRLSPTACLGDPALPVLAPRIPRITRPLRLCLPLVVKHISVALIGQPRLSRTHQISLAPASSSSSMIQISPDFSDA